MDAHQTVTDLKGHRNVARPAGVVDAWLFANHVSQVLEHVRDSPLPPSFKSTPSNKVAKQNEAEKDQSLRVMRKLGGMIVLSMMIWKR